MDVPVEPRMMSTGPADAAGGRQHAFWHDDGAGGRGRRAPPGRDGRHYPGPEEHAPRGGRAPLARHAPPDPDDYEDAPCAPNSSGLDAPAGGRPGEASAKGGFYHENRFKIIMAVLVLLVLLVVLFLYVSRRDGSKGAKKPLAGEGEAVAHAVDVNELRALRQRRQAARARADAPPPVDAPPPAQPPPAQPPPQQPAPAQYPQQPAPAQYPQQPAPAQYPQQPAPAQEPAPAQYPLQQLPYLVPPQQSAPQPPPLAPPQQLQHPAQPPPLAAPASPPTTFPVPAEGPADPAAGPLPQMSEADELLAALQ